VLAANLKQQVRSGRLTLGPMMTFDFWPGYLEIFKAAGMDFALLDLEHGCASLRQGEELCRTARLLDLPLIVRPEGSRYHLVRKYLDMGAAGLMIPWVDRCDQVEEVMNGMFVPPRGRRGPGGPAIFANRGLDRQGWEEVESSLFVMIQIETLEGLANLASLAQPAWVDAVMPGPYDLSLNVGPCGEIAHPEVSGAIVRIRDEAAAIGKPCGMVVGTPEQARPWIDRGFHFFLVSEPAMMVRQYAGTLVKEIRDMFERQTSR
jgi:2-keto-3-deoxy-L-rhamnonate aldolase RhmA